MSDRLAHDLGDMARIVSMQEGAEPRELGDDVRRGRETHHAGAPFRLPLARKVLEHAGVLQHEGHLRAGLGEIGRVGHLPGEDLEVEAPAVIGETGDVAADGRVGGEIGPRREAVERIFVPVELHAHAAHQRIAPEPVELRPHVGDGEVGVGDDRVRPARFRGRPLHPGGLVLEAFARPVRLDVDRLDDVRARDVGPVFVDRIVAPDRLVGAENARLHRADEPRQVGLAPDVVMPVDDRNHAALLRAKVRT